MEHATSMRRKFIKPLLLAILVLLTLLALVFVPRRIELSKSVENLQAELRSQGVWYPMTDLDNTYPSVPNGENAALLFWAAADAIKLYDPDNGHPTRRSWTPWYMGPKDPIELRLIQDFVIANQEALQLAYQALERPRSRYPISIRESFSRRLYLGRYAFSVRDLLVADAQYRAIHGDAEGFARSLLTLVRLGDSFHGLPLSFQGWAFYNIHRYPGWFLSDEWNSTLGEPEYKYMAAFMDRFEAPSAVAGVAAVLGSAAYDKAEQARKTPALRGQDLTDFEHYMYVQRPWIGRVTVFGFQLSGKYDTQRLAELKALSNLHQNLIESGKSTRSRDPFIQLRQDGDMSETFVREFNNNLPQLQGHVRAEDYRRIARVRIACELYRHKFDRYPEHFGELVPQFLDELPKRRWHLYDEALRGTGLSWSRN